MIKIRRARWSPFRLHYVNGWFAYELQVGPLVIQWTHKPWEYATVGRRLHIWTDPFWRR